MITDPSLSTSTWSLRTYKERSTCDTVGCTLKREPGPLLSEIAHVPPFAKLAISMCLEAWSGHKWVESGIRPDMSPGLAARYKHLGHETRTNQREAPKQLVGLHVIAFGLAAFGKFGTFLEDMERPEDVETNRLLRNPQRTRLEYEDFLYAIRGLGYMLSLWASDIGRWGEIVHDRGDIGPIIRRKTVFRPPWGGTRSDLRNDHLLNKEGSQRHSGLDLP